MTRATDRDESSLLCSVDGCTRSWTCNFGRRLCAEHAREPATPRQAGIPTPIHEPAPHWADTERDAE